MELILVRHGQPAWVTDDGRGRNDPGLTELGRAQARLVGARIADPEAEPAAGPVDRLLASPTMRAQQTAAPIAEALDQEVETHAWLEELRNPPEWEGAPIELVQEAFNEVKGRS